MKQVIEAVKSRGAWKALSNLLALAGKKSKFSKALPSLYDDSGLALTSVAEMDQAKLKYFGKNECAQFDAPSEVCDSYNNTFTAQPEVLQPESIPSLLKPCFSFAEHRKAQPLAWTESCLIFLLVHPVAGVMTRVYHPLYVKMALRIQEPILMKAGLLTSFLKKRDAPHELLKSQRCVTLGQVSATGYYKLTRRCLEPKLHLFVRKSAPGTGVIPESRGSNRIRNNILNLLVELMIAKKPVY